MKLRLDKFLGDMGLGTRAEIKKNCRDGRIRVNGMIVKDPGTKVDPYADNVFYLDREVEYNEYEYYLLNKPQGVISATEDKKARTVLDLITESTKRKDLFPVGRLDKDTEGLLLITNDGLMAHELLSPKKHVDKTYYLKTNARLTTEHIRRVSEGIELEEDFITKPGRLEILEASDTGSAALITIHEGKFHQIKRMMEAMGNEVIYLKRLSMGPLSLPEELKPGEYRRLTTDELLLLKSITG